MELNRQKTFHNNKQPYAKPRLRTIQLLADEVLGIGCKTQYVSGPTGDAPQNPCLANSCFTDGS